MTKPRAQTITEKDLAEYLTTQNDFDLELFVYRTARELGLAASHGGTYNDPITEKPRQYDVRVTGRVGIHRVALAVECKSLSTSYPLLVSRIPRSEDESFHEVIFSHQLVQRGHTHIVGLERFTPLPIRGLQSRYPLGKQVGKSTAQVGRNERGDLISGDNQVFDKWSQALASAADLISTAKRASEELSVEEFFTCVLPVLVVSDDTLWLADYSDAGALTSGPTRAPHTTLFVGREYSSPLGDTCTLSHLEIYTRSEIGKLFTQISKPGPFWQAVFPEAAIRNAMDKD